MNKLEFSSLIDFLSRFLKPYGWHDFLLGFYSLQCISYYFSCGENIYLYIKKSNKRKTMLLSKVNQAPTYFLAEISCPRKQWGGGSKINWWR
jgi:hypothetical protein